MQEALAQYRNMHEKIFHFELKVRKVKFKPLRLNIIFSMEELSLILKCNNRLIPYF